MKHAGRIGAIGGIALAIVLFARAGFGTTFDLLRTGGYGLVLAASLHLLPMTANARAWKALLTPGSQYRWSALLVVTWMRESINTLLPVARIGGEIAAYRFLTRRGGATVPVAASLVVDTVLSVFSQSLFTLLGIGLALDLGVGRRFQSQIESTFALLFVTGTGLVVLQRSKAVGGLLAVAARAFAGRWTGAIDRSVEIDRMTRAIHENHRRVATCLGWQMVGWLAGAVEVWLALVFLGHPVSIEAAIVIEVFVQTVSSVAFVVPGAYGVQEGAFLLIGSTLGLDGPAALALAASRRIRDIVVFAPGLAAWSWTEVRASDLTVRQPK